MKGGDDVEGAVEILYDGAGVPHVDATTQLGAYYGQGWATAADRLFQLELLRRSASGRLADCFGAKALAGDCFQRSLAFDRLVGTAVRQLAHEARDRIEAYCLGVNRYADAHPWPPEFDILSLEPEPWTVEDVLHIGMLRSLVNASWRADLVRAEVVARAGPERARHLFARYGMPDAGAESLVPGDVDAEAFSDCLELVRDSEAALQLVGLQHVDTGSNTWAVDGSRTRSGRPLLANDLHMGFVVPNPSFLVRLRAPGLDVRGVSIPGMPGVLVGHNQHIAWGATALMADAQDVFVEELDADGERYRFRDEWLPLERWEEEIPVRDARSERLTVRLTHHGPLVRAQGRFALALRWERLDTPPGDPTFHALNTATDWSSFREALRGASLPPTDFTYADVDGNVGAQSAGWVPRRAAGDGSLPVPGPSGKYEWLGFLPFEDLPSVFRPAGGLVVRANQDHDAGACGRFLSARWHPPYRARRIRQLVLEQDAGHTVESFAAVQFDRFSAHPAYVAGRVAAAARGRRGDARWEAARRLLETWDGQLHPGSAAATLAKECATLLKARLLVPLLGKRLLFDYQRYWPETNLSFERILAREDAEWLPDGLASFESLYTETLDRALQDLARRFGSDDIGAWRWGKLNPARFAHPLERAPFFGDRFRVREPEVGGDGECVFAARGVGDYISSQQSAILGREEGRGAIFGASARMVWDVGDWDESSLLLNLGQAGDPRSRHAYDQLGPWQAGSVQKLPYSWERLLLTCERRSRLPKPSP